MLLESLVVPAQPREIGISRNCIKLVLKSVQSRDSTIEDKTPSYYKYTPLSTTPDSHARSLELHSILTLVPSARCHYFQSSKLPQRKATDGNPTKLTNTKRGVALPTYIACVRVGPKQQYKLFYLLPFLHHPHYLSKRTNMEKPDEEKEKQQESSRSSRRRKRLL